MAEEFDTESALGEIAEGLGLGSESEDQGAGGSSDPTTPDTGTEDDVPLDVSLPASPRTDSDDAAAPDAAAPASSAPKTWRTEAAAEWSKLSPTVQAEIAKREEDIFRGLESYRADAGYGKSFKAALEPFMPVLNQYGLDPIKQVSQLMAAHQALALGSPQQKQVLFNKLAQDYGVTFGDPADQPYVDPEVAALREELSGIKSTLTAQQQREQNEVRGRLTSELDTFVADPANIHFNDVADDMAKLLRAGVVTSLKDAYERSVWANPVTRAKEQARVQTETAAKAKKAAEERAAAARKATQANVRSSAKAASATTPLGSIDSTLEEGLAAIRARG